MDTTHAVILAVATAAQLLAYTTHPSAGGHYTPQTEVLSSAAIREMGISKSVGGVRKMRKRVVRDLKEAVEDAADRLAGSSSSGEGERDEARGREGSGTASGGASRARESLRLSARSAAADFQSWHDGHRSASQKDSVTFMTNTADKLLYELKNLHPLPAPYAVPQFNPIPLAAQRKRLHQGGLMVVGISTVYRQRENYLFNTVSNVMERLSEEEKGAVKIVVMNGQIPSSDHLEISRVRREFADEIESGLLELRSICGGGEDGGDGEAHPCRGHPQLDVPDSKLLRRWGDDAKRVRWRAKQVLDVAALMSECSKHAGRFGYFLMLEDDVKVAEGFPTAIRSWVDAHLSGRTDWTIASFYNPWKAKDLEKLPPYKFFGVIGQLFRTHDLPHVVAFLRRNFDESPLDWLFVDYMSKHKGAMITHSPSLFQHLGKMSSLAGKVQPSRAAEFEEFPLRG